MAARKWTIRNYNAFLREAKRKHGVTHREGQDLYRRVRDRLGRSVRAVDVERHPRIGAQEARNVKEEREVTPRIEAALERFREAGFEVQPTDILERFDPDTEFEVTATTEGGTPRRRA